MSVISFLLEKGVDINFSDHISGATPLIAAILNGSTEAMVALYEYGCDVSRYTDYYRRHQKVDEIYYLYHISQFYVVEIKKGNHLYTLLVSVHQKHSQHCAGFTA